MDIGRREYNTSQVVVRSRLAQKTEYPSTAGRKSDQSYLVKFTTDLDSLVPAACYQNSTLRRIYPLDSLDWCTMLRYLNRLTSEKIEHAACIVCSGGEYFISFLQQ